MNAVSGTRRTMKELVDGSIRVQIDIDPFHRKAFLELFPEIDMPVALAPLSPGFEHGPAAGAKGSGIDAGKVAATTPKTPKSHKPQQLSQYAAMLCSEAEFQNFLEDCCPDEWLAATDAGLTGEEAAAEALRHVTEVTSRAEYDKDPEAAKRFHEIREEFRIWMAA